MRTAGARSASRSTGVDLRLLCPQVLLQSPFEHMIEHMQTSAGWPEFAPPVALSSGPLGVVQGADREIARLTALRARAVAEFAASRPASAERRQGEAGAMSTERWAARPEILQPVSEWATPELQVALSYTEGSAQKLLEDSLRTVQRLPGALAALEGGALHVGHRWPMLDLVAEIEDDRTRAEIEAELLRWVAARAAGRQITTPPQLRDKANRVIARRGARDAAEKLRTAIRGRGVHLRGDRPAGMAAVTAVLTEGEARAFYAALAAYADAVEDEPGAEPRSQDQKMADCLLDLVLRPGESGHPPVQVALTLVAAVSTVLGGDAPGELGGKVVPAEMVRQLLRVLAGVDAGAAALAEPAPAANDAAAPVDLAADPEEGWSAEFERRLFAGEFDGPDPVPDDVIVAAAEQSLASGAVDLAAERALAEADDRWWADFERGLHSDPDPPPDPPPARPPTGSSPPARGWWAAADCAVEDASQAMYQAQLALRHARRTVRTAEHADAADEAGWQTGPAGRISAAADAVEAMAAAAEADRVVLAELLARTGGGGLADRPRIALVDALSGALVSLTDLPGLRRAGHCGAATCHRNPEACMHDLSDRPGLGAPGPTEGYWPSAALDRFLRARDRRCRFPGCRRPVARGELDHRIRYPDGPTAVTNLAGLCVGNHRGKHQAPGWAYDLDPDGTLTVTTPTGLVAVTTPPPY